MGYGEKRPQDFRAYLEAVSALNKRIKKPVFHAVISAGGHSHSKEQLIEIAEKWMKAMGYGDQPYLAVFHKDTKNNHIHLVSTRINKQGKKINSGFEKVRAIRELNKIMGVQPGLIANEDVAKALTYRFSTRAQFAMILEQSGYKVREKNRLIEVIKFGEVQEKVAFKTIDQKINAWYSDKSRAAELKAIISNYRQYYNTDALPALLKQNYNLDLNFHAAPGKPPYGYTVIDHEQSRVFKGGEIMPLKELLENKVTKEAAREDKIEEKAATEHQYISPVSIAQDIDDEAVHGRKRRKKRAISR
ncbi:MAG: relaxase/mobilization nuclease domain-containing protein [Bacteroidetes bacterium]|nr:relaxase/mobilization nuclease domain-containing protein [Bacteroidota bacterium]